MIRNVSSRYDQLLLRERLERLERQAARSASAPVPPRAQLLQRSEGATAPGSSFGRAWAADTFEAAPRPLQPPKPPVAGAELSPGQPWADPGLVPSDTTLHAGETDPAGHALGEVVPGMPPGTGVIRWHEQIVNQTVEFGTRSGALIDAVVKDSQAVAQTLLGGASQRTIAAEELAQALAERIPPERLQAMHPEQLAGALEYINEGEHGTQAQRIEKTLLAYQTMDKAGTPPMTRQLMIDMMGHDEVPGHAWEKFSTAELAQQYGEIQAARYTPGEHSFELGSSRELKFNVNPDGTMQSQEVEKHGFWSKVGGFFKKVGSFALKAASFIPGPIGLVARIGSAVVGAVNGIKSGSLFGAISGIAGGITGGITSVFGKAVGGIAGTISKVSGIVGQGASAVQGILAAKSGGWGSLLGAIGSGVGSVAGAIGAGFSGVSETMSDVATWANRLGTAGSVYNSVRSGDYLGAIATGSGLAADIAKSSDLQTFSRYAATANNVYGSIRSGDYLGAAEAVSSFAAQQVSDPALRERLETTSAAFADAGAIQGAIQRGDWLSVASSGSSLVERLTQSGAVGDARKVLDGVKTLKSAIGAKDPLALFEAAKQLEDSVAAAIENARKEDLAPADVQPLPAARWEGNLEDLAPAQPLQATIPFDLSLLAPATSAPPSTQLGYLGRGATGPAVLELQRRLNALGGATLSEDGVFGADTEAAVRRFQDIMGLEVDGKVGPDTLAALDQRQRFLEQLDSDAASSAERAQALRERDEYAERVQRELDIWKSRVGAYKAEKGMGWDFSLPGGYVSQLEDRVKQAQSLIQSGTAEDIAIAMERVRELGQGVEAVYQHRMEGKELVLQAGVTGATLVRDGCGIVLSALDRTKVISTSYKVITGAIEDYTSGASPEVIQLRAATNAILGMSTAIPGAKTQVEYLHREAFRALGKAIADYQIDVTKNPGLTSEQKLALAKKHATKLVLNAPMSVLRGLSGPFKSQMDTMQKLLQKVMEEGYKRAVNASLRRAA